MSVSHGFVAAHGGSISVSSEVGLGTRFEIRLPLGEEPALPAEAAHDGAVAPQDMARLGGTRILVVEDEPDVLDLLQRLFGEAGCQLTAAANVGEAIDVLRRREFDLVLTDLMVPGGGGRAVAEYCREMGDAAPPLVVMSGRLERSLHDEVIALGAARSVEKPFALSKLLRTLSEVLQARDR